MKATELRIGNYNMYNGKLDRINDGYDIDHVRDDKEGLHQPIPLTEQWLLKLGLLFEVDIWVTTGGRQSIMIPRYNEGDDFYVLYQEDIGCGFNPLRYIESVHQLQNLYHALTGKELTLKTK